MSVAYHILVAKRHQQLVADPIEQRRGRILVVDEPQTFRLIAAQFVAEAQQKDALMERIADDDNLLHRVVPLRGANRGRPPQRNGKRHVLRPPFGFAVLGIVLDLDEAQRALDEERNELLQLRLGDFLQRRGVAAGEQQRQIGHHVLEHGIFVLGLAHRVWHAGRALWFSWDGREAGLGPLSVGSGGI